MWLQAAEQVRTTGVSPLEFDKDAVGAQGAGYDYHKQQGLKPTERDLLTSVALPSVALAARRGELLGMQAEGGVPRAEEEEDVGVESEGCADPEFIFKREVQVRTSASLPSARSLATTRVCGARRVGP